MMNAKDQLFPTVLNRTSFERTDILEYYRRVEELFPAEERIFTDLSDFIANARILDVGIGGGRTTHHLLPVASEYFGIDYVPQFVEDAGRKYPDAEIKWGDATDLNDVPEGGVDLVLFSHNGIDCMSHHDRVRALSEFHRVLRDDGVLVFSSHNRDSKHFGKHPWQRKVEFSRNYLVWVLHSLYHYPRHLKMKKYEVSHDEYAIVNDCDHRYAHLFYYISPASQIRQLEALGFSDIKIYGESGDQVVADDSSTWLYYTARKHSALLSPTAD